MSEELKYKLYDSTSCISEQRLFDYIDNKLSAKEQHLVEKHLLDCELCSDALDGLQTLTNRNRINNINIEIRTIISQPEEKKVIAFNFRVAISVAAGLLLLLGGIFFFNNFNSSKMMDEGLAELKETPSSIPNPEEKPTTTDSISFQLQTVTESNTLGAGKDELKADKKVGLLEEELEQKQGVKKDQEPVQVTLTTKLTDQEVVADEIKSEANPPKTSVAEDYRSTITTTNAATSSPSVANTKSEKSKEKDLDISKNVAGAEAASGESQSRLDNTGYYAKEETNSKNTENTRFESRKRANKKAELKDPEKEATLAYAPPSVTQQNQNEVLAGSSDDLEKTNSDKLLSFSYLDSTKNDIPTDGTFAVVTDMPQFPGGDSAMMKFISKNFKYPTIAANKGDENIGSTKIIVQFIVDKSGLIKNAKIIKGVSPELNKEALRVVNSMPRWKSGKLKGESVDVRYNLPIQLEVK